MCVTNKALKFESNRYPSHARMWLAPIKSNLAERKKNDFDGAMADWYNFSDEIKSYYGVDMDVLSKPFAEEQEKYYIQVHVTCEIVL